MRIILSIILSLIAVCAQARSRDAGRLYFSHQNSNTGLSQNTVKSVLQDNVGYIWIGTHQGLNRYDGVEFIHYNDLPGSIVTTLACDREGRIWVGTNAGVTIYDPVTEKFTPLSQYVNDPSISLTDINVIFCDRSGNILIADDSRGVMKVTNGNPPRIEAIPSLQTKRVGGVTTIASDPEGNLWFGTFGYGIFLADSDCNNVLPLLDDEGNDIFGEAIVSRLIPAENKIYVATENLGLYEVNIASHKARRVFYQDETGIVPYIRDVMFYSADEVWLATESGLYLLNLGSGKAEHYVHDNTDPYSLSDNALYTLFKDKNGGVWIGSYFGGIDYVDVVHSVFNKYYKGYPGYDETGQRVRELAEDDAGNIWIATEDAGISKFNPKSRTFTHLPESKGFTNVQTICIDNDKLWIGTFSNGLRILDLNSGRMREIHHDGKGTPASEYIFNIYRTPDGTIYLGTMSGTQIYDPQSDKFVEIPELKNIFCYVIREDSHRNLWVGTYSKGLFCRKAGTDKWVKYTHSDDPNSIPSDKVYGIYEDFGHRLWIMTQEGICTYNPKTDSFDRDLFAQYNIPGMVYQMIEDNGGQYWLTTNNGIYMIDDRRDFMRHYGVGDGLICNQFNYASSLRASDGTIYLGAIEGMVSFKPSREYSNEDPRRITITGIYLSDNRLSPNLPGSPLEKNISLTDKIQLPSHHNSLAFKVATLSFGDGTDQPIKYRLVGVDPDWRYTTLGNAKLAYSGLAPGNYALEVAALDPLSGFDSPVTRLGIRIKPPILLSRWAILIYILLIGAVVFAAFHFYNKRRNRNEAREHAADLTASSSTPEPTNDDPQPEDAEVEPTAETIVDSSPDIQSSINKPDQKFLTELNEIIHRNYADLDFSMEFVFEQMHMSHTSFYRKLKGIANLTPVEYIRDYRLARAAELFEAGYTNVTEVSTMVGFSAAGYFARCFQKRYGMNPKAYADHFKKKQSTETNQPQPTEYNES